MTQLSNKLKHHWILTPLVGCSLFIMLYIIAAILYPGGSGIDKTAVGYRWSENYWCNLLDEQAINGQVNSARPVAITAMIILCLSLEFFLDNVSGVSSIKKSSPALDPGRRVGFDDLSFFVTD